MPPSTESSAPVRYDDASEARKRATCAISSGCAHLPNGALVKRSAPKPAIISVSTTPGWIEFTRMPDGPSSMAAIFVSPRSAHLDDPYDDCHANPVRPAADDTFTIEPPPPRASGPTPDRMPRNGPRRFTAQVRCIAVDGLLLERPAVEDGRIVHEHVDASRSSRTVSSTTRAQSGSLVTSRWQ